MYAIFCDLNPPGKIRDHFGIVKAFSNFYTAKFPHYNPEVVKLAAKMFVYVRMGTINDLAEKKMIKRLTNKPKTRRGARKLVDQTF